MEQLRQLKAGVRELAHRKGLELEISLGQELRYFEELPLYLEQGRALTLAESRYALVEFKPGDGFQTIRRAVRELIQSGFIPVLAHAERYLCLRETGRTEELVQSGACLQVNAESLTGGLFDRTAAWCLKEIQKGRIHFAASDMHRPDTRPPRLEEAFKNCQKAQLSRCGHHIWEKSEIYSGKQGTVAKLL